MQIKQSDILNLVAKDTGYSLDFLKWFEKSFWSSLRNLLINLNETDGKFLFNKFFTLEITDYKIDEVIGRTKNKTVLEEFKQLKQQRDAKYGK